MAATVGIYNSFRQYIGDGTIDLDANNLYLALVLNTYTYAAANTIWANVSTYEAATGDGYTTGGANLTTNTLTYSGATATFDADDVAWAALTKTFRYAVLYVNATVNSIVKPLICCITLDATPADIVVSGATYTISWNASGIFTFS